MAEFEFNIELFGDEQLAHTFERIGRRAQDLDPVFRSIFDQLVDIMGSNFTTRGRRTGAQWKELRPATIVEKIRAGSSSPESPLIRFGDLFEAAGTLPSAGSRTGYHGTWATFELVGEAERLGGIHHHGSFVAGIPARPFFRLTHEDREDFVDEMHHYLFRRRVRGFAEAGRPVVRKR